MVPVSEGDRTLGMHRVAVVLPFDCMEPQQMWRPLAAVAEEVGALLAAQAEALLA